MKAKFPLPKKKSTNYHFFFILYLVVNSGLMNILIHWQKTQPCRVHSPGFRYAQILISSHTKVQNTFNTIKRDLTCFLFSLSLYNQQSISHSRGLAIIISHINGIMQCGLLPALFHPSCFSTCQYSTLQPLLGPNNISVQVYDDH